MGESEGGKFFSKNQCAPRVSLKQCVVTKIDRSSGKIDRIFYFFRNESNSTCNAHVTLLIIERQLSSNVWKMLLQTLRMPL